MTGERVVTSRGGFNPTWQRHVAAYSEFVHFVEQLRERIESGDHSHPDPMVTRVP